MEVVIFANTPGALHELCGVSLLERHLRNLLRLGFDRVTIVTDIPEKIRAAIEPPSWARAGLSARIVQPAEFRLQERALFLPGDIYCDTRLIRALTHCATDCVLVDSNPPDKLLPLLQNTARDQRGYNSGAAVTANYPPPNDATIIDAAEVPAYIVNMRRTLRPFFFSAPNPDLQPLAERFVFDTGQNGTLDIPAIIQSPVETWIMRWLCRTAVTPNQLSALAFVVALIATAFFATGHLWLGMIPALSIGVLDGLDGKQARVKIETTDGGKWEHYLDAVYETSWWAALAYCFRATGQLPTAWLCFFLIMLGEGLDKIGKHIARQRIHCLLDDYSPFDRFVRLIAARRDVYLWALTVGLALGAAASTYRLCAIWGMITAGVHLLRGGMIALRSKVAQPAR